MECDVQRREVPQGMTGMKKFISTALAVMIASTSTIGFAGEAEARRGDRYRNHYNYNYDHYRYRRHHHHNGDAVAAGILGLALGAIIVGSAQRNHAQRDYYYDRDPGRDHVRRCERRYRSYDRYSDTFIGRDGRRYYCTL